MTTDGPRLALITAKSQQSLLFIIPAEAILFSLYFLLDCVLVFSLLCIVELKGP